MGPILGPKPGILIDSWSQDLDARSWRPIFSTISSGHLSGVLLEVEIIDFRPKLTILDAQPLVKNDQFSSLLTILRDVPGPL